MLIGRVNDWGVAIPAESQWPERSSDGAFRFVSVPGLTDPIQFMTVTVVDEHRSGSLHEMLVIAAHNKDEPDAVVAAVSNTFPGQVHAAIRKDATGWARVSCSATAPPNFMSAAVAIVKASGGWDESSPIVIEIGGSLFDVYPTYRDARWYADVRRST